MKRFWRRTRLTLHLLAGLAIVITVFPFAGLDTRRTLRQRWSQRLLGILGIDLRANGSAIAPGTMLVANHVSWIDIFVINAVAPAAFISKAEVRKWPAIGWLAAKNETVFLQRGSRGHARIIGGEIGRALQAGSTVALFPEGTTTDGSHVLHFHAALLQPALDTTRPIQPLALRYRDAHGEFTRAAAYYGDMSLLECIGNIVAEPALVAEVEVMPAEIHPPELDRRPLANALQASIAGRVTAES